MKTLLILSASSLSGLLIIFFYRFRQVRKIPHGDFLYYLKNTNPFFFEFHDLIVVPSKKFYSSKFLPWFFKRAEKLVHGFRIQALKAEHSLFNLKHYFRGKHETKTKEHSPYWNDMKEYKEDLKEEYKNVE